MQYTMGMVLSGGGARGLAHVGVLRALAEEGIEPEVLAGTSAGAVVAALHAAGYSADEMVEFFVKKNPFRMSRLALSRPGIFDTDKVVADFLEYFPEDSFEALRKRIFLTATDLVDAQPEIFASGRLIRAILASASAPLVFTPTEIGGHHYSDGGITNNFPIEPLTGHCRVILGVYVSPIRPVDGGSLKSSLAVAQRSLEIGMFNNSKGKFHECDLLICPPELSRFGPFDTKHMRNIEQIGYHAAREQMERIAQLVGDARERERRLREED